MSWRLHLTNQAIQGLEILPSAEISVLAAWVTRRRVFYFDLATGARLEGPVLDAPPAADLGDAAWVEFLATLQAPHGVFLPQVRLADRVIHQSLDGAVRLYDRGAAGLTLQRGEVQTALTPVPTAGFTLLQADSALDFIVGLDADGKVHVFKGGEFLGQFDTGLVLDGDARPAIALTDGPLFFVTDGQRIVVLEKNGQVKKTLVPHYLVGDITGSADSSVLMTADRDTNVIRVYQGEGFGMTHQCHADDLLARATQPQLIADLPPTRVVLRGLRLGPEGVFAFTLAGVICVSALAEIKPIPTTFI